MADIEYLVFDDALRDTGTRAVFDRTVQAVNDGTARRVKLSRGQGFDTAGEKLLSSAVLEYALGLVPADEFDAAAARDFSERMRALFGWYDITYTLTQWVETRLCAPYFENRGTDWDPDWQLRADADASHLPESFFEFACYVAIGELKHGPSYASVSANRIFDWVTKLGSDLPERLKKHGTGELPSELAAFRGTGDAEGVTAKANDALATIRIAEAASGGNDHVTLVLDYLREVDGEHQSLHEHVLAAHIDAHGFDDAGLAYLVACAGNIQEVQHRKTYPAMIANERSLRALLALRESAETRDANGRAGATLIAAAPAELRPLYEAILA